MVSDEAARAYGFRKISIRCLNLPCWSPRPLFFLQQYRVAGCPSHACSSPLLSSRLVSVPRLLLVLVVTSWAAPAGRPCVFVSACRPAGWGVMLCVAVCLFGSPSQPQACVYVFSVFKVLGAKRGGRNVLQQSNLNHTRGGGGPFCFCFFNACMRRVNTMSTCCTYEYFSLNFRLEKIYFNF